MKLSELSFGSYFTLKSLDVLYIKLNLPVIYAQSTEGEVTLCYQTLRISWRNGKFFSSIYLLEDNTEVVSATANFDIIRYDIPEEIFSFEQAKSFSVVEYEGRIYYVFKKSNGKMYVIDPSADLLVDHSDDFFGFPNYKVVGEIQNIHVYSRR